MMKAILTASAMLLLGVTAAAAQTTGSKSTTGGQQMTQAECQSTWGKADASKAGSLTQTQAQAYVTSFSDADINKDGKLSSTEFLTACQQGKVHSTATTGAGSGTTGTTSPSSSGSSTKN
ncbi:MAG: hypothetical protein AB7O57_12895 [Hyphomicrobiaceae bacterium]